MGGDPWRDWNVCGMHETTRPPDKARSGFGRNKTDSRTPGLIIHWFVYLFQVTIVRSLTKNSIGWQQGCERLSNMRHVSTLSRNPVLVGSIREKDRFLTILQNEDVLYIYKLLVNKQVNTNVKAKNRRPAEGLHRNRTNDIPGQREIFVP